MLGSCAFGSFLGGGISKKINLTSQTLIIGSALQVVGVSLVYGFTGHNDKRYVFGFTAIYGLGVGLCFAAGTMIAAIEAIHDDLAAAQGAVAQARVFGGALGLAICTVIVNHKMQTELGPGSGSGFTQQDIIQIQQNPMTALALAPELRGDVRGVYMDAFKSQMLLMIAVASSTVLVSLFTYRSEPAPIIDVMVYHKENAARSTDTELGTTSSIRSLVR